MDTSKDIYDKIYAFNSNYNFHYPPKDVIVDLYAKSVGGYILDAGCGQGIHLRRMLENGIDAFGIEISTICCQKYLGGLPHENIDICSFASQSERLFNGIVCCDVLEHIPLGRLDETIESLTSLAPSALLGLANHSDIQCGEELHLIQEDIEWWTRKLSLFYSFVYPVASYFDGKFFCVEVSQLSSIDQLESKWRRENGSVLQLANAFDVYWNNNQSIATQHQALQAKHQALQAQHQALQALHRTLQTQHQALLDSKMVRISNKLKKIIGKPACE